MNITDKESEDLLRRIYIAAPCNVGWDTMSGDDKKRACAQCNQNVYNISKLTKREAAQLIVENEGKVCLTFFRRRDGTIMTENCPVGLRRIRDAIKACAIALLLALSWFGIVNEAHAQGLIGAPPDPGRLGQSNEIGVVQNESWISAQIALSTVAFIGLCIWLVKQIRRKKGSILLIAITLSLTFAAVGLVHGLLSQDKMLCEWL